ncbi:MAG: tetratricopeptide repeat protein [Anaerolineae bacterium]|nr:tetratricopeptide repeat protein [Anaerolineae bacterium]
MALAVFEGGFDAEAARTVADALPAVLAALTSKSMIRYSGSRYVSHETTQQYAAGKLAEDPGRERDLRTRHCAYFAAWLHSEASALPDGEAFAEAIPDLETERANIQAAWMWAVAQHSGELLDSIVEGVGRLYRRRGPLPEGTTLFESTVAQLLPSPDIPPTLIIQLRIELVHLLSAQAHHEQALEIAQRITAQSQALGSTELECKGHHLWGQTLQQQGKYDAAQPVLEQALALARAGGQEQLEADSLRELGNIASRRGEYEQAQQSYERAVLLCRALENRRGESAVMNNLGAILWDEGKYSEPRNSFMAARTLYQALGDLRGKAKALDNLANVAADQGDYSEALQLYQETLQIHRDTGNPGAQSTALNNPGGPFWELGKYSEAKNACEQAIRIFRENGNRQAEGETLANPGMLELRIGNPTAALAFVQQAIAASEQSSDPVNLSNALTYLGKIHVASQQLDDAGKAYRKALAIRQQVPHRGRTLEILAGLAGLTWLQQGAAQALGEIEPVFEALESITALDGADDPYHVYWICYQILAANTDPRADDLLATARRRLLQQASQIPNPELRRSFLESVLIHRQILAA